MSVIHNLDKLRHKVKPQYNNNSNNLIGDHEINNAQIGESSVIPNIESVKQVYLKDCPKNILTFKVMDDIEEINYKQKLERFLIQIEYLAKDEDFIDKLSNKEELNKLFKNKDIWDFITSHQPYVAFDSDNETLYQLTPTQCGYIDPKSPIGKLLNKKQFFQSLTKHMASLSGYPDLLFKDNSSSGNRYSNQIGEDLSVNGLFFFLEKISYIKKAEQNNTKYTEINVPHPVIVDYNVPLSKTKPSDGIALLIDEINKAIPADKNKKNYIGQVMHVIKKNSYNGHAVPMVFGVNSNGKVDNIIFNNSHYNHNLPGVIDFLRYFYQPVKELCVADKLSPAIKDAFLELDLAYTKYLNECDKECDRGSPFSLIQKGKEINKAYLKLLESGLVNFACKSQYYLGNCAELAPFTLSMIMESVKHNKGMPPSKRDCGLLGVEFKNGETVIMNNFLKQDYLPKKISNIIDYLRKMYNEKQEVRHTEGTFASLVSKASEKKKRIFEAYMKRINSKNISTKYDMNCRNNTRQHIKVL